MLSVGHEVKTEIPADLWGIGWWEGKPEHLEGCTRAVAEKEISK